jgi:hypothetical protein
MCWYTYKKSSYKSPHVAEEDIKVYKVLMKTSVSFRRAVHIIRMRGARLSLIS